VAFRPEAYNRMRRFAQQEPQFINLMTGEPIAAEFVPDDLEQSRQECMRILAEIEAFQQAYQAGQIAPGQKYLSFANPLDNGYDRTGPTMILVR
jgi:hypothetical protein